jgi:uncharacterized protein (DUF2237 family)
LEADAAPPVVLAATAATATEWADLADLRRHAIDEDDVDDAI